MCFGGNNTTTSKVKSTTSPNPAAANIYGNMSNLASQVSQTPYKSITQGVAPINADEQAAIAQFKSAYGNVSPYITQAADFATQAAQPLSQSDINNYYNPYASAVSANLQNTFAEQLRDTTGKLTGAAGGVGGDRIAVGQGEAIRQNQLAAGQTFASIYQNALQAAQNQQGIEQASGYLMGNLGMSDLQAQLQSGNSLFSAGQTEQQTAQDVLNAKYTQQMQQAAYPFQTAQWYQSMALPAAYGYGTTQTGKQSVTPPAPNPWSQVAGLGLTALGAFSKAKRGGRIKGYAEGGGPDGSPYDALLGTGTRPTYSEDTFQHILGTAGPRAAGAYRMHSGYMAPTPPAGYIAPPVNPQMHPDGTVSGFARGGYAIGGSPTVGGSPYGGGTPYGGVGGYVPSGWQPPMMPSSPPIQFGGSPPVQFGGIAGMGSNINSLSNIESQYQPYMQAGYGLGNLWNDFSGGSGGAGNMGWNTTVSPTGAGFMNEIGNLFAARGGEVNGEPHEILMGIARGKGGKVEGYETGGGPTDFLTDWTDPDVLAIKDQSRLKDESRLDPEVRDRGISYIPPKAITDRLTPEAQEAVLYHPGMSPEEAGPKDQSRLPPPAYTDLPGPSPYGSDPSYYSGPKNPLGGPGTQNDAPPPAYDSPFNIDSKPSATNVADHEASGPATQMTDEAANKPLDIRPPVAGGKDYAPGADPALSKEIDQQGRIGNIFTPQEVRDMYQQPTLFGKPISNTRLALMAAGLGMMGGQSPFFMTNIGEGGLKGISALKEFQQMDLDRQSKALEATLRAQQFGLDVARFQQEKSMKGYTLLNQIRFKAYQEGQDPDKAENDFITKHPELFPDLNPSDGSANPMPAATPPTETVPVEGAGKNEQMFYPKPSPKEGVNNDYYVDTTAIPVNPDQYNKSLDLASAKTKPDQLTIEQNIKNQQKASEKEISKADDDSKAGGEALQYVYQANSDLDALHNAKGFAGGFLTPGPMFPERAAAMNWVNMFAQWTGHNDLGNMPEYLGDAGALQKLQTYAGFNLSRTLGTREAMQIIQQAMAAVYGGHLSWETSKKIIYNMEAVMKRNMDRGTFITNWGTQSKYGVTTGAGSYFDRYVGQPEKYVRRMNREILLNQSYQKATPEEKASWKQKYSDQYGINPATWGDMSGGQ